MGLVYKLTNKINGKIYIGITKQTLQKRLNQHVSSSKSDRGLAILRAIKKYTIKNFLVEVLEDNIVNREELAQKEQYYIKFFESKSPKGYNLTDGGESPLGLIHSDKTKDLISKKLKGRANLGAKNHFAKITEKEVIEIRNLYNDALNKMLIIKEILIKYNIKYKNLVKILKHKTWKHIPIKYSDYTKEKMKKNLFGGVLSPEHLENLRITSTGRKLSEETKKKISTFHKGKIVSIETKEKLRKAHKGKIGCRGESNPSSKLTENQVKEIREIYKRDNNKRGVVANLSKMYKVSFITIKKIVTYKTWKFVSD